MPRPTGPMLPALRRRGGGRVRRRRKRPVRGRKVEVGAAVTQLLESDLVSVIDVVGMAGDRSGDLASGGVHGELGRRAARGGGSEAANGAFADNDTALAQLLVELAGAGDTGVPPGGQINGMAVQGAASSRRSTVDQLVRGGRTGEATHGLAVEPESPGDLRVG